MISPAIRLIECLSAWCVEPDRQHNNTIFPWRTMQICSELDAKEETDLPQVQLALGEFHCQLEASPIAKPARPGLGPYAYASTAYSQL
jgi:hypothetical protein